MLRQQVADGNSCTGIQEVAVSVIDVNEAPFIATSPVLSALENQTSVATITAVDVEEGVLNTGLLEHGDYQFTIKVIDSEGEEATAEVSLTVEFGDSPEIGAAIPVQPDINTGGADNEFDEANQPNIDPNGNGNTEPSKGKPTHGTEPENAGESGQTDESTEELSVRESIEAILDREPISQPLIDDEEDMADAERQHAAASGSNIVVKLLIQQFSDDDVVVTGC